LTSQVYTSYLPIEGSTILKAAVFDKKEKLGRDFTLVFNNHKAVGKTITLDPKPHKAYVGSGKEGLINGVSGSDTRYGDKEWLGFWGKDVTITIEFDKPTKISSISTRFYNANGQWIYVPKEVSFGYLDVDNSKMVQGIAPVKNNNETIVPFILNFTDAITVESIEISIENYGTIPEGLQGAGNKAWTFLDEIVVK